MLKTIRIKTEARNQMIDITRQVAAAVAEAEIREGTVTLFVPHTSAAVTINENSDPDVQTDLLDKLARVFPHRDNYRHSEGNSDAHLKTSLVGPSLQVIVNDGDLLLGTWQGIYFCEFDGPRTRQCHIQIL